jgi:hypothetical protein
LRLNKKGVIDLPIKLMIVILIVSLSVPLLASAMEKGEQNNAGYAMNGEIDKIFNAVAAVHYSGIGSSRTVSVNIPDGCGLIIPGGDGSDGYMVKMTFKGKDAGVRYMDRPPVKFLTQSVTLSGSCMLLITSETINGNSAVRVDIV